MDLGLERCSAFTVGHKLPGIFIDGGPEGGVGGDLLESGENMGF